MNRGEAASRLGRARRRPFRLAVALSLVLAASTLGWDVWRIHRFNAGVNSGEFAVRSSPRRGDRILIFAPHCDDETLAVGGLIQRAVKAGAAVRVVFLTNGDGFPLSATREFAKVRLKPADFVRLGLVRQNEAQSALRALGLTSDSITFLGYPDQGLAPMWLRHWAAPNLYVSTRTRHSRSPYLNSYTPRALYCGASVLGDVGRIMQEFRPTLVICPHPNDNHPDHWATYAFVTMALGRLPASSAISQQPGVAQALYLVHRGDWPVPQGYRPEQDLPPPAGLTNLHTDWARIPISPEEQDTKFRAVKSYASQMGLMRRFLLSFVRTNELLGGRGPGPLALVEEGAIQVDGYADDWSRLPVSVEDPKGDSIPTELGGAGDIGIVKAAVDSHRLYVQVETRKPISSRVAYQFGWHGMQGEPAGTQVATVQFARPLPPGVQAVRRGRVLEVSVPKPPGRDVFLSVATQVPRLPVDRSGWRILTPQPAR